jgi:hypothetical protein
MSRERERMAVMLGSSHAIRSRANVYAGRERRLSWQLREWHTGSQAYPLFTSFFCSCCFHVHEQPASMHIPWQSGANAMHALPIPRSRWSADRRADRPRAQAKTHAHANLKQGEQQQQLQTIYPILSYLDSHKHTHSSEQGEIEVPREGRDGAGERNQARTEELG